MKHFENLNQYVETYSNNPFDEENRRGLIRYVSYCIDSSFGNDNYLELGIGHGVTLNKLKAYFKRVVVLEGASSLVKEYQGKYDNVEIIETYFEQFSTREKFDNIGMGFILEHVDDPIAILRQFAQFLSATGRIFIGVPSASSMHRILAQKAGMLNDIRELTPTDHAFGHKRLWTYSDWKNLLETEGFKVEKIQGLAFKPFSTSQLASLNLAPSIIDALDDLSIAYPELANALFIEASYVN